MDPILQTKLAEILGQIVSVGEKVGIQAIRLWPEVVKITFIKSLAWIFLYPFEVLVFILVGSWILKKAQKAWGDYQASKKGSIGNDDHVQLAWFWGVCSALAFAVALVAFFLGVSWYPDLLAGVISPEAKTVLDLIDQTSKAAKK